VAGNTYYIVVDGYSSASGAYVLSLLCGCDGCVVTCPATGIPEGEPPLVDDYVDVFNGGCASDSGFSFQTLEADADGNLILCGVSGWYLSAGVPYRDTDWYILLAGAAGPIEITADAEYTTFCFELSPQDCATVAVAQQITAGPCDQAAMTIDGYGEADPVWFWAGPTVFAPPGPDTEYDYVVWFSGLLEGVAAAPTTWSTVKALFD
jgi:hypothetical protein